MYFANLSRGGFYREHIQATASEFVSDAVQVSIILNQVGFSYLALFSCIFNPFHGTDFF